jgi:hypothetical protein
VLSDGVIVLPASFLRERLRWALFSFGQQGDLIVVIQSRTAACSVIRFLVRPKNLCEDLVCSIIIQRCWVEGSNLDVARCSSPSTDCLGHAPEAWVLARSTVRTPCLQVTPHGAQFCPTIRSYIALKVFTVRILVVRFLVVHILAVRIVIRIFVVRVLVV